VTDIPVLVAPSFRVLSQPYVTPAMFKGYPHWLDLDDLIQGGASSVQDDVLADTLLAASDWAVGAVEDMPLHGHLVSNEQVTTRIGASGRVHLTPAHVPVRAVTALAWGTDPSNMNQVTLPDATMWFEDGRRMSFVPGGFTASFRGPALQFGPPVRPLRELFVQWSYVAGFPSATVSAVAAGAQSVTVADPAAILPGDVLRVYDPGVSEALTVAATYVPQVPVVPPAATSIPLAVPAVNAHVSGTGITGFPRKVLQAVIAYEVALLMREDVAEEEPASGFGPAARTTAGNRGGQAAGLVNDAIGWLRPYAPVLRS
jgi:hypothetical protein